MHPLSYLGPELCPRAPLISLTRWSVTPPGQCLLSHMARCTAHTQTSLSSSRSGAMAASPKLWQVHTRHSLPSSEQPQREPSWGTGTTTPPCSQEWSRVWRQWKPGMDLISSQIPPTGFPKILPSSFLLTVFHFSVNVLQGVHSAHLLNFALVLYTHLYLLNYYTK